MSTVPIHGTDKNIIQIIYHFFGNVPYHGKGAHISSGRHCPIIQGSNFCDFNFESPDSIPHIYRCDKRKGKTEKKKLDKQCPVCFFEAQTKQNLEKHVVGQHSKVRYLCEVCNKQFSRKESLNGINGTRDTIPQKVT